MIYLIDYSFRGDKMNRTKHISAIVAFIAAFCILFTSCTSADRVSLTGIHTAEKTDSLYHTPSTETETVSENDYTRLLFDKKTFTVSVEDIEENHSWTTLPKTDCHSAYAFGLTLYTQNGIYELNTQDSSVAFGTASYEIEDGILTVSYILSDKETTAEKSYEDITSDDVYVSFCAVYSMTEQTMNLKIDLSQAKCTPNAFIGDFTVLPCFGSSFYDGADDYFLIPDGSGAVMHLGTDDAPTDKISVKVYGSDPFTGTTDECAAATVPVFGIKRADSAFAAVITDGDALAIINANRKTDKSPSAVGAIFSVTPVIADNNGSYARKGATYNGEIAVSYKFLSGNSADYISMAAAAREEFIAQSVLSSVKNTNDSDIPFQLTVVGADDTGILTTTQQTLDILGILKGKGINNISINYKGLLSGGLAQKNLYTSEINKKLGGSDGLETLYEYTKKQGCELLIGTNIFSASNNLLINGSENVSGINSFYTLTNDMSYDENTNNSLVSRIGAQAVEIGKEKANPSIYSQTAGFKMNILSLNALPDKFSSFLEDDLLSYTDGISVQDAGYVLYSDTDTDRETAKDIISAQTRAVSNYCKLTVEGGNIYTVYNAQLVSGMDFDTFYTESSNYEPVPFVQAILHGYTYYTGKPIDAGDPLYRYDMLRFIEYGALPGYEWIYSNSNIYCYTGYLLAERVSEIVEFYNDACEILGPLADETIVSHRKISKDADGNAVTGVYCTTYSDGTEVYVNYTGSIVSTSDNIAVGPYDYVAVKR